MERYSYKRTNFKIDCKKSAYIAGLIWADGHLAKDRLKILFSCKDYHLIMIINGYFYNDQKAIKEIERSGRKYCYLAICRKSIRESFSDLGLCKNDDGRLLPKVNFSTELFWHFLRGFIDGDGHISKKHRTISLAGRLPMLEQLYSRFDEYGFTSDGCIITESTKSMKNKINYQHKYGSLKVYTYFQLDFFILLYKNSSSGIRLERKYNEAKYLEKFEVTVKSIREKALPYNCNLIDHQYAYPHETLRTQKPFLKLKEISSSIKKFHQIKGMTYSKISERINPMTKEQFSSSSIERFIKTENYMGYKDLETSLIMTEKNKIIYNIVHKGQAFSEIAKDLEVSVKKLKRLLKLDWDFEFRELQKVPATKKEAFLYGFIISRGGINSKGYFSINIKTEFKWILQEIMELISFNRSLQISSVGQEYSKLSIGDPALIESIKIIRNGGLSIIEQISQESLKTWILKGFIFSNIHLRKIATGYNARLNNEHRIKDQQYLVKIFKEKGITDLRLEKGRKGRLYLKKEPFNQMIQLFGGDTFLNQLASKSKVAF
jgi:hypothetical protein